MVQYKRGYGGVPVGKMNSIVYIKEPNIVEDIKTRRLEWAGHITRMEEERIPKRVLNGSFSTTRPVGTPRTRWADVVQRDALQLLGIRGWRSKAANRDEWRRLMRGGHGPEGAVAPYMDGWKLASWQFVFIMVLALQPKLQKRN
jgi:hypothetical protein